MAQPVALTPNAIVALNGGDVELRPVVQVLDVRQIGTNQNVQERYRLILSDGGGVQQAMLATQLNDFVKTGRLVKGSIVRLQEYICNTVKDRKIVIVLNMDVLVTNAEMIGEPKEGLGGPEPAVQQQPAPVVQQQTAPAMPQQQQQPPAPSVQQYKPAAAPPPYQQSPAPSTMQQSFAHQQSPMQPFPQQQQSFPPQQSSGYAPLPSANSTTFQPNATSVASSAYGRPVGSAPPAAPYHPPPSYTNRGPIARNDGPPGIVPIAALNPYHGRWTIKARITAKSDMRRFNNARGDGKVFNFDLLDAEGGEIRVTCFNNVADQFYERARVGQVYMVSKGSLKAAVKAFNHLKNDWEIMFEKDSVLDPCPEDAAVPQQVFDFKPITHIETLPNNAMVDLIGVVVAVNQTSTIMRKNGTETQKRTLQLRDMSGKSVEFTMWGSFCAREGQQLQELVDSGQCPVLAIKAGRISDFSGKSVGTISSTQLMINPDHPEAQPLRQWFEREGRSAPVQSISREGGGGGRMDNRKTVSQIKDEGLGRSDKPDFISIRATIHFIKTDTFCYTACPLQVGDRQCNKKVTNNGDGTWRCDRCDQTVPECDYRYMLSIQVMDHTGSTWLTAFQEPAEELLGVKAKDLFMWKQEENGRFLDHIANVQFTQHHFKLRIKEESFNDEQRVKCIIQRTEKCDFTSESKYLLDMIGKMQRGEPVYQTAAPGQPSAVPPPSTSYGAGFTTQPNHSATTVNAGGGFGVGKFGGGVPSYSNAGPGGGGGFSSSYGGGGGGAAAAGGYGGSYGGGNGYGGGGGGAYGGSGGNSGSGGGYGGGGYGSGGGGYSGGYGGGGGGGGGGSGNCYKCGQGGHWARDCPNQGGSGRGYGGGGF